MSPNALWFTTTELHSLFTLSTNKASKEGVRAPRGVTQEPDDGAAPVPTAEGKSHTGCYIFCPLVAQGTFPTLHWPKQVLCPPSFQKGWERAILPGVKEEEQKCVDSTNDHKTGHYPLVL